MRSLLARCGDPQKGRKTIHVTGSKGKGSVSTMLAYILQAAGNLTALFTSPHLHSYLEQIALDLKPVSEEEFAAALESVKSDVLTEHESTAGPVSTFGILCLLFFHLVHEQPLGAQALVPAGESPLIDWQIVEVGLGGADDATNVFNHKGLVVITPISLEHTAILGNTPAEITDTKCGIITPGCTVVLAPQAYSEVKTIVLRHIVEKEAKLIDVGEQYKITPLSHKRLRQKFLLEGPYNKQEFEIGLAGKHQLINAATAVAAAEALQVAGENISQKAIASGLAKAFLPGRFEVVKENPLVIVDGAHNADSASALAKTLQEHFSGKQITAIIGVNQDKDIDGILQALKPIVNSVIATKSKSARAMEPELIAKHAQYIGIKATCMSSVASALKSAIAYSRQENIIIATGSLRIVAEIREALGVYPTSLSVHT